MTEADRCSKVTTGEKNISMSGLSHRSSSMVSRTDRLSGYSDYREEAVRSCTDEWTHTGSEDLLKAEPDPKVDQPQEEEALSSQEENNVQDMSGLAVKRKTMPNLLAYSNGRRSRTGSWNDTTSLSSARQSLNSENERSTYKQPPPSSSTSRHSDPGTVRNELLNFTRGSFSGGGRPHRAEGRPRSRKVHLSSAAKRVKKLEEAEARFSVQSQTRKPKCLPRLATIPE
eukprot:jgi/Phyca11/506047/fgenesh2_kg.PHYCAscaffold_17_\